MYFRWDKIYRTYTHNTKCRAYKVCIRNEFDIDKILNDVKLVHISGRTPTLSKYLYEFSLNLVKEAKKRNIIVSYDSNYRSKLWSLDEASKFMKEILPFVDIAFLGILDFKNISVLYQICNVVML
ncbi:hypothetical protein [Romboutsia ilealis]|uniref:hypothetical protein n=1 Tax=Romboutsia ilealis TaxID=1115758 RepID=UPI002674A0D6|nr:hypothetical protein [Romboutsia ilealis]